MILVKVLFGMLYVYISTRSTAY